MMHQASVRLVRVGRTFFFATTRKWNCDYS